MRRRSSRIVAASSEKKAKRMAPLIAAQSKRFRKEADAASDDEEEAQWYPGADDGDDNYEEGEEDEEEEDDDDDDDEDFSEPEEDEKKRRPKAKASPKKRKMIEISDSESSGQDEPVTIRASKASSSANPTQASKIREILNRKNGGANAKAPKSILKKSSKFVDLVSPDKPAAPTKRPKIADDHKTIDLTVKSDDSKDDASESHRRPTKQRAQRHAPGPDQQPVSILSSGTVLPSSTKGNTLDHFFDEILEWNFYEALMKESKKEYSYSEANDGSEEGEVEKVEIAKVPSQFRSYDHYFSVWKPLALEEVQAQTLNNVSTDTPGPIPITATGFGTTFLSKTCKIRVEVKKQAGPRMHHNAMRDQLDSVFVNDLVLITPSRRYFQNFLAASKGSSKSTASSDTGAEDAKLPPQGMLGIVTTQKASREGLTMIVLGSQWRSMDQAEELFLYKLNNLVTSVREFRALCDCRDYELMPLLLSGQHQKGSMRLDSLGIEYVRWLNNAFNDSQLEAITAAATSEGFTLIKGPPGTGKTTTLKGLLNSLHLREYSRYYNAVLDVARRPDHETSKAWAAIGNEKPHILVTAPSNAAVDNIVGKVIEEGFCDGEGRRYFPKIVRVGRGLSANARRVGLDEMIDQICSQHPDDVENKIRDLKMLLYTVERDSVVLRDHLRQLVAWIDSDPERALAAQVQEQQRQQQQQPTLQQIPTPPPPGSPPPVSPPLPHSDMPPLSPGSPTYPPGSPTGVLNWSAPSSPTLYPSSPPAPPSPPVLSMPSPTFASPMSRPDTYGQETNGSSALNDEGMEQEEEEEDEAFPVSFGEKSPEFQPSSGFNTEETNKAFNAFFDDANSDDEDEPLPKKEEQPSPPPPSNSNDVDMEETEEDEPLPNQKTNDVKKEDTLETDGSLAIRSPEACAEDLKGIVLSEASPSPSAKTTDSTTVTGNGEIDAPITRPPSPPPQPSLPPPPSPPVSPPPPPPLESPPPLPPPATTQAASFSSEPEVPPPPAKDASEAPSTSFVSEPKQPVKEAEEKKDFGPIDYTKYHRYRVLAQQINGCLEKLSETKLELQRYEFARRAANEKGKLSQAMRQSLEVSFLDTAHIVFTTLSSAGVAALDASSRYDVLVVDEAAQAVELSTIIPMKFGSRQCVLVGDPQQLSATVFSRTSGQSLYERSLFERIETCGHPVHMLRTQYRSHPMISDFPRNYFYDGKLQDGENVKKEGYDKPYHHLGAAFMPLTFWNLLSSRESSSRSVSRSNVGEAELSVNLYLTLKNSCPPDAIAGKVGMITPYSQQMEELRNRFRRALGDRYDQEVEINTVDGFQGREKDIIILSTVRADPKGGVGFLNDIRRMNVALTRAKFACYVIGSEPTLRSSKPWAALLDHSYKKHCIVHVDNPKCNLLTLQPGGPGNARRQSPPPSLLLPPGSGPASFGPGPMAAPPPPFSNMAGPRFLSGGPGGGRWSPPNFNGPPHLPVPQQPIGPGWRGRGRGNDGMRGGRRGGGGGGRGGRGNPGRGRGGFFPNNGGGFPVQHQQPRHGEFNPPPRRVQGGPIQNLFPPGQRRSPSPNVALPSEGILGNGQPHPPSNMRPPLQQQPSAQMNPVGTVHPPPPAGSSPQGISVVPPPPTNPPPAVVRARDPRQRPGKQSQGADGDFLEIDMLDADNSHEKTNSTTMQKLVFSMRDTMPQFVSSLRAVDEWKRIHAKRADAITQAEYDANAKYIKSPFARSLHIEDLVRFLDDTVLDIDFMVQLPSIEKCLEQWWELYSKGKPSIDQDQLRIVYFDLAFVLVEAKTETIHKNAVSMILRSSWTKWSPKEPPLSQIEFFRLLFILCHLMTTTNRLGDYVVFFQETLSKIRRHYQSKHTRTETLKRPPKSRRKSSLIDIMTKASRPRVYLSPNQIVEQPHVNEAQFNSRGPLEALSVKVDLVQTQGRATRLEDETADRFVEILDRNSRGQHVVIDPLLYEKRFQEKWKRSNLVGNKSSSQEMMINQNPLTNKYYPPMFISRVRTNLSPSSAMMSQCKSVPALKLKCNMLSIVDSEQLHDDEILRRSLSRVTLKKRLEVSKAICEQHRKHEHSRNDGPKATQEKETELIYLAIST